MKTDLVVPRRRFALPQAREHRGLLMLSVQLGTILICVAAATAQTNDSCSNPTLISGIGTFPFSTVGATTSFTGTPRGHCFPPGPPGTGFGPATLENDVWFLWINDTCTDPVIQVHTCGGTTGDTMIAFYRGLTTCPAPWDPAECCNDDTPVIPGFCPTASVQSFISCESQCCNPVLIQIGQKIGTPPVSGSFTISCSNPSGCGRPQGCCFPDGHCTEIAPLCCSNLGGTPLGLGNHCTGDSDGDGFDDACCDPVPNNDLTIDLSTGIDDANATLIPVGAPDDTWRLECAAYPPLGPVPRPAIGVPQHFAWCPPFPGTTWIGHSPLTATGFPNGDYCYWSCFCLRPGFQNASLNFSLRADNGADVYLHNLGPAVSHPLVNAPISSHTCSTLTTFSTTNQALFAPGENCLEVRVENIGGATGFNLSGQFTAENARCCCAPLEDGSGCRRTTCPAPNAACRPTEETVDPVTGQIIVTRCDCAAAVCNEPCDDRRSCNGLEMCHGEEMCMAGDPPCPEGTVCREPLMMCLSLTRAGVSDFGDCLGGPDTAPEEGCTRFDLDDDGDCDLGDYGDLQRRSIGH